MANARSRREDKAGRKVEGIVSEYYASHAAAAIGLDWPIEPQQKNRRLSRAIFGERRRAEVNAQPSPLHCWQPTTGEWGLEKGVGQ
jgi:hypothetical protein